MDLTDSAGVEIVYTRRAATGGGAMVDSVPEVRIDRDGRIASRIALPLNAHIVGASAEYLYVATVDALAIQGLSRHRWP